MRLILKNWTPLWVVAAVLMAGASGSTTASAQQGATPASAVRPGHSLATVEWVYRTKYGFTDEWFRIFKKYQVAILERQKQLGYVKEYIHVVKLD